MYSLNIKGQLINIDEPWVMGIINITPDSFYDGGKYMNRQQSLDHARRLVEEGTHILDMGAYSSRPGAEHISEQEELDRLIPVIELVSAELEILISADTFRSHVAKQAISSGAHMINDISAGDDDLQMIRTIAELKVPYIIMHKKGRPMDMQRDPKYQNVSLEVLQYLQNKKRECEQAGIVDLIADPGFGFGKTIRHNFQLLSQLQILGMLDLPLLVGLSRKSMIYRTLNIDKEEALSGTQTLQTLALERGANILRVHDVKEALQTIKLWSEVHSYL